MRIHITIVLTLNIFNYLLAEDCVLTPEPREDAWDKALHKDLLKGYDSSHPPINQTCVSAFVTIQLKSFSLDEYEGVFTAKAWTRMRWNDERLSWSPADYGGLEKIAINSIDIWKPSLKLLNTIYPFYFFLDYSDCSLSNEGTIRCVEQVVYESFCSCILKDWPYDVQNCTLEFGDDDRFGITNFSFPERPISMFGAEYGVGWNIMDMHSKTNATSQVQLSITLTLERQAYGLVVILIVPCIILSLLTFTSTLFSVEGFVRFGFSCFSLISHFVFTGTIDEFLPKHSADTPVILSFVKGSTIVTITSVILTYILSEIQEKKTVPFAWIALTSNKVLGSSVRYLLFPKWISNSDLEDPSEDTIQNNKLLWVTFANLLNSIYIVIVVIVYICLFSIFMPKQPPFEY